MPAEREERGATARGRFVRRYFVLEASGDGLACPAQRVSMFSGRWVKAMNSSEASGCLAPFGITRMSVSMGP